MVDNEMREQHCEDHKEKTGRLRSRASRPSATVIRPEDPACGGAQSWSSGFVSGADDKRTPHTTNLLSQLSTIYEHTVCLRSHCFYLSARSNEDACFAIQRSRQAVQFTLTTTTTRALLRMSTSNGLVNEGPEGRFGKVPTHEQRHRQMPIGCGTNGQIRDSRSS